MTIKDKYLDKMLEKLDGYQPSAEPDWDAFYQKNKDRIPVKEGKGIVSKSFVRISLIVIAIVAVFLGGYYFMQPSSISDQNSKPEQNTNIPTQENAPIDARQTNEPADEVNQNIIILPRTGSPDISSNDDGIEKIIASPNTMFEGDEIQNNNQPADIIIDDPDAADDKLKSDSAIEDPVIIRKTVIIKDTIRLSKPIKKMK